MGVLYTNNASTTLAAGLNDSATSTTVASSSGFPTISGSNYFYATLELADGSAHEIVKVTAVSGTTWTIVRGQDNTSARAFSSSDKVELRINSALLTDVVNDALASTFTRQDFTGDGSDTTFTLSRTPNSENDLFVFIEGVFQPHSTYSLSGTTLTFSEAPANSREITVYHVSAAVSGDSLSLNTFSGNGSTTAFTMSVDPVHENNTMVFIEGVYQEKSTYATSGTTLTFDTAPANGTSIDVTTHTQSLINVPVDASVTLAKMAANSVDSDQYVDGSIDTAHIADSQITVAKMAANSVDSDQYVDGSIDTAHYADNSITGAELADNIVIAGTLGSTGKITADAGIDIDNFNIDGTTIALSSGNLTLDSAGDIYLDADGADIVFLDGGTHMGTLKMANSNLTLDSQVADKDIIFSGNDGGAAITALTLDMSDAGAATFNGKVSIGTGASISPDADADNLVIQENGAAGITIGSSASSVGSIRFADSGSPRAGMIYYDHVGNSMRFYTSASERMRVTAAGDLYFGQTSGSVANVGTILQANGRNFFMASTTSEAIMHTYNNTSNSGAKYIISFRQNNTEVGSIEVGSSSTALVGSSDYRLKENVDYTWDATTKLKQLKPCKFNWILDDTNTLVDGFLAHEVQDIVPEAIFGEKDAVYTVEDEANGLGVEGAPKLQGIDQSKLIPLLVKTIQELEARIKTLEDA